MNSTHLKPAIPLETQRGLLEKGNSYEVCRGQCKDSREVRPGVFKGTMIERENELQTNSEGEKPMGDSHHQ